MKKSWSYNAIGAAKSASKGITEWVEANELLTNPFVTDVSGQLWSLKLATVRLCRKQGNVGVCERLLLEELPIGDSIADAVDGLKHTLTDATKIIRSVTVLIE